MFKSLMKIVVVAALLTLATNAFAQQRGQGGPGNGQGKGDGFLFKLRNMDEEQIAVRDAIRKIRKEKLEEEIASGCSMAKDRLERLIKFDAFLKKVINMSDEEYEKNKDDLKEEFTALNKPPRNGKGKKGNGKGKGKGLGLGKMDADEALDAIRNLEPEELALHEAQKNLHKKRLSEDIDNGCARAKEMLEHMEKMEAFATKVRNMSDEDFEASIEDLKAELKELRPKKKGFIPGMGMGMGPGMGRGHGRGMNGPGMGMGQGCKGMRNEF